MLFVNAVSTIWLDFLNIHNIFALILLVISNLNHVVNTTVILISFYLAIKFSKQRVIRLDLY